MTDTNLNSWPLTDRRATSRVDVLWHLKITTSRGRSADAIAWNACVDGLHFRSAHRLDEGEVVNLDVCVGRLSFFRCSAKICRVERDADRQWAYGVSFQRIERRDQAILNSAINIALSDGATAVAADVIAQPAGVLTGRSGS